MKQVVKKQTERGMYVVGSFVVALLVLTAVFITFPPIVQATELDEVSVLQNAFPLGNSVVAAPNTTVFITYDMEIDETTVTSRTFVIYGMQSGLMTATHGVIDSGTLIVTPSRPFQQGELVYTIVTTNVSSVPSGGITPVIETAVSVQWQFNAGTIATRTVSGFDEVSSNLAGVKNGDAAWGDYDHDGDLDLLLTGDDGNAPIARLYANNGNSFSEEYAGSLTGVSQGDVAWGDYDLDGDLDILLTGNIGNDTGISKLYENTGNGFTERYPDSLTGVRAGSAAWGDYDNDGDLDILLTGLDDTDTPIAIVYQQGTMGFSPAYSLAGVSESSAVWGDYDNDGDLDILLAGRDSGGNGFAAVYQNTDEAFISVHSLAGVSASNAVWGDFDNDGDLDILLTGDDGSNLIAEVCENMGEGFGVAHSFAGVRGGSAAWGDYDNDGDLDILLTGDDGNGNGAATVYQNTSSGFSAVHADALSAMQNSSAAWGDYDGDGDLDILLMGDDGETAVSILYSNEDAPVDDIVHIYLPVVVKP